jgi:hypothetical protein
MDVLFTNLFFQAGRDLNGISGLLFIDLINHRTDFFEVFRMSRNN